MMQKCSSLRMHLRMHPSATSGSVLPAWKLAMTTGATHGCLVATRSCRMTPQQDTKKCRPSSRTCRLACLTSSQQLLPWSCNHPVSLNLLSIVVPTLMHLLYHWYLHHLSLAVWLQLLLAVYYFLLASTANKSKIDQKIATFAKV